MEVVDPVYRSIGLEGKLEQFKLSKSFKKELKKCISDELIRIFDGHLNLKKIYLIPERNDTAQTQLSGTVISRDLFFFLPDNALKNYSYAPRFTIGIKPHYSYSPKLIIENLIGDWPILDPSKEIESGSLRMTLEFNRDELQAILRDIEKDEIHKRAIKLDEYKFPVFIKDLNINVVFKIAFCVDNFDKEKIIDYIGEVYFQYNMLSETETHDYIKQKPKAKQEMIYFDEAAWISYYKSHFEPYYNNPDTIAPDLDINKMVAVNVNMVKMQIEAHNNSLLNLHKVEFETPKGLIHSYNLIETKNKNEVSFKVDLGSSNQGVQYFLQKLNETDFPIKKIEIKGIW